VVAAPWSTHASGLLSDHAWHSRTHRATFESSVANSVWSDILRSSVRRKFRAGVPFSGKSGPAYAKCTVTTRWLQVCLLDKLSKLDFAITFSKWPGVIVHGLIASKL
jgi:hypothetical protein